MIRYVIEKLTIIAGLKSKKRAMLFDKKKNNRKNEHFKKDTTALCMTPLTLVSCKTHGG